MKRTISVFILLFILIGAILPAQAAQQEQRSEFVAPIMIVNTSFLNVRTGPSAQYTVLLTTVGGTELPVLGVAPDRVWYLVSTVAGIGWVNSEFTVARGDFANVPVITLEEYLDDIAPLITEDDGIVEDADTVGSTGFVAGRDWGISVLENHPARIRPTIGAESPGTIVGTRDRIYNILEATTADGIVWYRINDDFLGSIWVEGPKTFFRPFACTDDFSVVVMTQGVRPAIGPDGSGTLDGNLVVDTGLEAYLLDFQSQQYKVELIDGNTGWIAADDAVIREEAGIAKPFCDTAAARRTVTTEDGTRTGTTGGPQLQGPRAVINTAFLNVRSGPGAQFTIVTTLSGGAEVPVLGIAPDGVWYLIGGDFGEGWINSEFTVFRGDGTGLPIVREATGAVLSRPTVTVTDAVTLYAAPDTTLGVIGALSGVLEDVPIVARTEDFDWVQLNTALGFGWVLADQVSIEGDTSLIPVVGS